MNARALMGMTACAVGLHMRINRGQECRMGIGKFQEAPRRLAILTMG
jgi:hypothetical protein